MQLLPSTTFLLPSSRLLCSSQTTNSVEEKKQWDIRGLKKEIERQNLRGYKKVGKASERLAKEQAAYELLMSQANPSLEQLEQCSNLDTTKQELQQSQERLKALQDLESQIRSISSSTDPNFVSLIPTIVRLNITDTVRPVLERGPKKIKTIGIGPRKPYFTYRSTDNIDIRVGRSASDNDELSCNPELRDGCDWWMHVAGYPGSHVVIRYTGEDVMVKYRETVRDAALLAAVNSKCGQAGKITVSMTRCRNVSKPRGAKPGLVHLNGDITPIKIDVKAEQDRLNRLQKVE